MFLIEFPRLWQRLADKLALRETIPTDAYLSKVVVPITDVDDLLEAPKVAVNNTLDLTAPGTQFVSAQTVPEGKRWTLLYARKGTTAGSSQIVVYDGSNYIEISSAGTGVVRYTGNPLVLEPGWQIGLWNTGNAGDAARKLSLYVLEEEAY